MYNENISNQIAVYKTTKRLIEFTDKLIPASVEHYAAIHAEGKDRKFGLSRIGIRISDYSGATTTTATANISATDVDVLYQYACRNFFGPQSDGLYMKQQKIISAKKDAHNIAPVTTLTIQRASIIKGEKRRLPVVCSIADGTGVCQINANHGISIQKGSYKEGQNEIICLTDSDFFSLIDKVKHFVDAWEVYTGSKLYRAAEKEISKKENEQAS